MGELKQKDSAHQDLCLRECMRPARVIKDFCWIAFYHLIETAFLSHL